MEENKEEEELEEEGEASSSFSYNGAETADNLSVEEEKWEEVEGQPNSGGEGKTGEGDIYLFPLLHNTGNNILTYLAVQYWSIKYTLVAPW